MAKNKPEMTTDVSVEEKLRTLYKLQLVASKIDGYRTLRGELPMEVEDLERDVEYLNENVERLSSELTHQKKQIEVFKEDKRKAQQTIEQTQERINLVRNNREYDALTKEIEYAKMLLEDGDKKIGLAKNRIEQIGVESGEYKGAIEERTLDLNQKKNELESITSETKQEEERLLIVAKDLEDKIDEYLLKMFLRTRKSLKNGLAVVSIERDACMGCFNKIPPQRVIDVSTRKRVLHCEYCGRILIDSELAEEVTANTEL